LIIVSAKWKRCSDQDLQLIMPGGYREGSGRKTAEELGIKKKPSIQISLPRDLVKDLIWQNLYRLIPYGLIPPGVLNLLLHFH